MFRAAHMYLKILSACMISLISACVIVPLGSEIDQKQIVEFQPGITHRSKVIEQIGEPNISTGLGFDVYRLEEGKGMVLFFPTQSGAEGSKEIYNLVFKYDARGLLQELRYEKSLDSSDPDFILLDNDFSGKEKDFTAEGEYSSVYISADGRLITAVSETNIVFQEVEGESREIKLEQINLDAWGYGIDCVLDLHNHYRKKQNPDFNWLIDIQDLRPLYSVCMTKGALGATAKGAFAVTADNSELAIAKTNQLRVLSQTGNWLSAPEADQWDIIGISFGGLNDFVITSSVKHEVSFTQGSIATTELKIRSLPSLNTIGSIRRPFKVLTTAVSSTQNLFALASGEHIELWRGVKEPEGSTGLEGPFELERVIPTKPTKSRSMPKYLNLSADGKFLLEVGRWQKQGGWVGRLTLWDTDDGRLIAEIANLEGLIEATFDQRNEIVIVSGEESWASKNFSLADFSLADRKYHSLKIWHLRLESLEGRGN